MIHQDPIFSISNAIRKTHALYAAHEYKLFQIISRHESMSLLDISYALKMELRATQALVSMCASVGLLTVTTNDRIQLSNIAETYLLSESPYYWGDLINIGIQNPDVMSYEKFKEALQTNKAKVYGDEDFFEKNEENAELTKAFTRAMHSKSLASSSYWTKNLDLSSYRCLLDIGGGSGAHSISAVQAWPHLQAIVYDRPFVCEVADEFIKNSHQESRIKTHVGDIWHDSFPESDVHFYCDIFHDWTIEKCKFLAKKSFESLPPGGRIIIHELLFNDDKSGPVSVAAYNIVMLLWTQGQQFSQKEICEILVEVGFVDVKVSSTGFGDWSIVSGVKE